MDRRAATGKLASTSGRPHVPARKAVQDCTWLRVQCSGDKQTAQNGEQPPVKRPRYRRPWERWWGGAPRVRVRKLDDRQREQLAELAILNERLAGNQSPAARRRIEWLKHRRKEWELIYHYVSKRDAAVSLALIEEANRQASAALSESVRERQGISTLKRHLVSLQGRLAEAHERLHMSQVQRNWHPVAFAHQLQPGGLITFDLFGQPWVMFRGTDGSLSCIKDECAHRACPLSLGKIVDGQLVCRRIWSWIPISSDRALGRQSTAVACMFAHQEGGWPVR
ncbi:hypothetical protein WJX73_005184 [Symbiochloris irregularis]|uniref:Rieske domain-containing protein n=1 Tax=Symbiochloris irregularis TaxID=706552 RepID=A0AAW1P4J4_9CHLO